MCSMHSTIPADEKPFGVIIGSHELHTAPLSTVMSAAAVRYSRTRHCRPTGRIVFLRHSLCDHCFSISSCYSSFPTRVVSRRRKIWLLIWYTGTGEPKPGMSQGIANILAVMPTRETFLEQWTCEQRKETTPPTVRPSSPSQQRIRTIRECSNRQEQSQRRGTNERTACNGQSGRST